MVPSQIIKLTPLRNSLIFAPVNPWLTLKKIDLVPTKKYSRTSNNSKVSAVSHRVRQSLNFILEPVTISNGVRNQSTNTKGNNKSKSWIWMALGSLAIGGAGIYLMSIPNFEKKFVKQKKTALKTRNSIEMRNYEQTIATPMVQEMFDGKDEVNSIKSELQNSNTYTKENVESDIPGKDDVKVVKNDESATDKVHKVRSKKSKKIAKQKCKTNHTKTNENDNTINENKEKYVESTGDNNRSTVHENDAEEIKKVNDVSEEQENSLIEASSENSADQEQDQYEYQDQYGLDENGIKRTPLKTSHKKNDEKKVSSTTQVVRGKKIPSYSPIAQRQDRPRNKNAFISVRNQ